MEEIKMAERIARVEADLRNVQDGNKIFRDEMCWDIKEIRKQNEAIYEVATSVKLIAQDLQG